MKFASRSRHRPLRIQPRSPSHPMGRNSSSRPHPTAQHVCGCGYWTQFRRARSPEPKPQRDRSGPPDSRLVGYSVNGQVNAIDVETGTVQRLGHAGAWSHDGTILFFRGGGNPIYRASATGGEPTEVTQVLPGSDQTAPQFLPDGRHFLFTATGGPTPGVYTALLGGSEPPRRIVDDAVVGAYSSEHLLFIRQGTLFAQPFDVTRLQLTGSVTTVADQIVSTSGRSFALSVSTAGPIAYRTGPPAQAQFAWFDRSGTPASVDRRF